MQYNLWNGNTDDVNNRVNKGLCEVAMITAPYNTEECHVLPVYDEPWVAVIPSGHALYSDTHEPVKPAELLPYAFHLGTNGVFMAEPISNVIGGSLCFITMLCTVLPELKRMEKEQTA